MLNERMIIRMLRALVCCVFLGRAWQHLRWDAPFRAVLWKQSWMEPVVEFFGVSWRDWVSHAAFDQGIQTSIKLFGAFYLLCAVLALVVNKRHVWAHWLLALGSLMLFSLGFLYFLEKGFRIGQWVEYSLQFSSPVFLIAAFYGHLADIRTRFWLKVAIALTFIGHGLYAAGIYPMPGHFVTMLMNGLGLTEDASRQLLVWAGYADFVAAMALFIPKLERSALYYMIFWGFATALARMVSYYDAQNLIGWIDGWLYQCIYRLVHGGLPLILLMALPKVVRATKTESSPAGAEAVPA